MRALVPSTQRASVRRWATDTYGRVTAEEVWLPQRRRDLNCGGWRETDDEAMKYDPYECEEESRGSMRVDCGWKMAPVGQTPHRQTELKRRISRRKVTFWIAIASHLPPSLWQFSKGADFPSMAKPVQPVHVQTHALPGFF